MIAARLAIACALLALPACKLFGSDDPVFACGLSGETDATIVFGETTGALHELAMGGNVPLISAPQGGSILMIGAWLLAPADTCVVTIEATAIDPDNGAVLATDGAEMDLAALGDGWVGPPDPAGLFDVTNIPLCPTQVARGVLNRTLTLEVTVSSTTGAKVAEQTGTFTPTCMPASICTSECGPH